MNRSRTGKVWQSDLLGGVARQSVDQQKMIDGQLFGFVVIALFTALWTAMPAFSASPVHRDRQIVVPQPTAMRANQEPTNQMRPQPQKSLVRQAAHAEVIEEAPPRLVKRGSVQQVSYGCDCGQCVGEPSCGYEVGCGAESCGIAGCGGCEPACGSESFMEASCGLETYGAGGCDACGMSSCEGACAASCSTDCYNFCLPIFRIDWCRFELFAGVSGFTGPANYANTGATSATNPESSRNGSSSFGFYEGLNQGRSLKRLFGVDLSSQFGFRATQSSLSGTEFTDESRKQVFVTGGLFRRVDFGLQYGVVLDYLNDDWWFHNNLLQMRGEISWNDGCSHEFGYQFMAGLDDSTSGTDVFNAAGTRFQSTVSFEPTDQHRFFFRGATAAGGNYYAFVGGTDQSDGILGGGITSAMRRGFAFQAGTTYLIPNEGSGSGGNENESWNMSMGVIYRPGGRQGNARYSRPMFDVADNGTFLVDRL